MPRNEYSVIIASFHRLPGQNPPTETYFKEEINEGRVQTPEKMMMPKLFPILVTISVSDIFIPHLYLQFHLLIRSK